MSPGSLGRPVRRPSRPEEVRAGRSDSEAAVSEDVLVGLEVVKASLIEVEASLVEAETVAVFEGEGFEVADVADLIPAAVSVKAGRFCS